MKTKCSKTKKNILEQKKREEEGKELNSILSACSLTDSVWMTVLLEYLKFLLSR